MAAPCQLSLWLGYPFSISCFIYHWLNAFSICGHWFFAGGHRIVKIQTLFGEHTQPCTLLIPGMWLQSGSEHVPDQLQNVQMWNWGSAKLMCLHMSVFLTKGLYQYHIIKGNITKNYEEPLMDDSVDIDSSVSKVGSWETRLKRNPAAVVTWYTPVLPAIGRLTRQQASGGR